MFFGLSPLELAILAALALTLFGPDKLPDAVRESARIIRHIRAVAQSTRAEVLEQLGPELAELDPRRLNPQAMVREHLGDLFDPLRSARDDLRREAREVRETTRFDDHADRVAAQETHALACAGPGEDTGLFAPPGTAPAASPGTVHSTGHSDPAEAALSHAS